MKSTKSYTCRISGNYLKVEHLQKQLEIIEDLSWYIFNLKNSFGMNWWFNQKMLYHQCRRFFPELNSKVIQNFIRYFYSVKKDVDGKLKYPKKPVNPSILLDYQNFNFYRDKSTKFTNYWLRFQRRNFPLLGKRILKKTKKTDKIQIIQVFSRNNNLFCKLSICNDIPQPNGGNATIGCDINYKRAVFSDNSFLSLRQLAHRKIEHKKNNQRKRDLTNYSKDTIHKVTTQIADDLQLKRVEVLIFEDLTDLRKSASKKLKTSKGKMLNYIINSFPYKMFQSFLEYKCLDRGIKVEYVNPAHTSKTCSRCGSRKTSRPRQDKFVCLSCDYQLDADLNGSRNIEMRYTSFNGLLVTTALGGT